MLVGGEGTRLRPLTYTTPKPLLPVANQVFLDRQLSWLAAHGVDEVGLSLGYLPDAFVARYPTGTFTDPAGRQVRLRYAPEPTPLGTAGAVRFAAEQLEVSERFVVCNGDVLTGLDLGALVAFHGQHRAEATIHLAEVDEPSRFGVVPTDPDGRVQAFVEKPPPGTEPTRWINAGTYVLEPTVLDRIAPGRPVSIEFDTFPRMLDTSGALYAMRSRAYWIDVGAVAQYLQAHTDLLAGRLGLRPPPAPARSSLASGSKVATRPGRASRLPCWWGSAASSTPGPGSWARCSAPASGSAPARSSTARSCTTTSPLGPTPPCARRCSGPAPSSAPRASVDESSIVGPGATIDAGATLLGARVPAVDVQATPS